MKRYRSVLGRMYDGIRYRGFSQTIVENFSAYAERASLNGLTDKFHPIANFY